MHPSALAKRVPILLVVITIAFYLYGLGKLPLVGPDEPRYAQVGREMFLSGDLITPTLGGHTWFEKPALLYWMIVASFKIFGVSEWSARLGPALCGLLTLLAVWCVGREVDFGFWSLIVTASCLGVVVFSRAASFDIVITMTTTWSLAFFLLHELRRKRLLLAGFYAFVGLSLLAKGLVGLVIPFGVIGVYFLLRRSWPARSVWLSLLWGLPLAAAVAAIWYGPVIAKYGWTFIDEDEPLLLPHLADSPPQPATPPPLGARSPADAGLVHLIGTNALHVHERIDLLRNFRYAPSQRLPKRSV